VALSRISDEMDDLDTRKSSTRVQFLVNVALMFDIRLVFTFFLLFY